MEMFKLGYKDAIKGVIMSVLSLVLTALLGMIQQNGLALTSTELKNHCYRSGYYIFRLFAQELFHR